MDERPKSPSADATYTATKPASESLAPSSRVMLLVYAQDGAVPVELPAGRSVTLGRASPSDVVIRDTTLSRVHARVTHGEGGVVVEDLDSLNGVKVNGKTTRSSLLHVGDEVRMGNVLASLQLMGFRNLERQRVDSYESFMERLEQEVDRASTKRRDLAVLFVQSSGRGAEHAGRWLPSIRAKLRSIDVLAIYGPRTVLAALPEVDRAAALALATEVTKAGQSAKVRVGLASFPEFRTAEELVAAASEAWQQTAKSKPVVSAGSEVSAPGRTVELASPAMLELGRAIERIAPSELTVLIYGETGVGKEVVAQRIHEESSRRKGPLAVLNCGAIPSTLIESTLFGHEKGSFTGADRAAPGLFVRAEGGTVFLDEIGELTSRAQAALLRAIETRTVLPVGGVAEKAIDVRIISATHRDLPAMCEKGTFRSDLLFRLNGMVLHVPPLRERPEDIPILARHFLEEASRIHKLGALELEPDAMALLGRYSWPGNVRELRNNVERAAVICDGRSVGAEHLDQRLVAPTRTLDDDKGRSFKERLRAYERKILEEALARTGGNKAEAARALRMPRSTFMLKVREHGLGDGES